MRNQLDATNSDLLVINSISTCFGHLYAHHQEIRLRSTAYGCPAVAVVMLESAQCTHLATRLSSITTTTTGQTTIGSGTQSDLLTMGIKMLETC